MDLKITGMKNMKSGKSRVELSGGITDSNGAAVDITLTATGMDLNSISDTLGIDIAYGKAAKAEVTDA